MTGLRTIGLNLNEIPEEYETSVVNLLKQCKQYAKGGFKVFFFHSDVSKTELEEFVIRNDDEFMQANVEIIDKNDRRFIFFLVTQNGIINNDYRYKVDGDVITGLIQYIKLMQHIIKRDDNKR